MGLPCKSRDRSQLAIYEVPLVWQSLGPVRTSSFFCFESRQNKGNIISLLRKRGHRPRRVGTVFVHLVCHFVAILWDFLIRHWSSVRSEIMKVRIIRSIFTESRNKIRSRDRQIRDIRETRYYMNGFLSSEWGHERTLFPCSGRTNAPFSHAASRDEFRMDSKRCSAREL